MKQVKDSKTKKDARRCHDADLFNEAFLIGYEAGRKQGAVEKERELAVLFNRERKKLSNAGR